MVINWRLTIILIHFIIIFTPGNMASAGTVGINGSIAGLTYNSVSVLHSYLRRDDDFQNVAVELGGDVTVREKDWVTLDEREYCS